MNKNLLEVKNLVTRFFNLNSIIEPVRGVSFHLNKGEILGIAGESGSGKSLTCLSILGLIPPPGKIVNGDIIVEGTNIVGESDKWVRKNISGKKIGMIFQDPLVVLDPVYNVSWQMKEAQLLSKNKGRNKKVSNQILIDILKKMDIADPEEVIYKYPHQLSGGLRQRVVIAIVLLLKPSILIADEATTSLDVTVQKKVLDIISDLRRDDEMSVIIVSHDLNLIAERCDRMIVMYGGLILDSAESKKVLEHPKSPYTQALVKCIPPLYGDKSNFEPIPGEVANIFKMPNGCPFHPRCNKRGKGCDEKIPELIEIEEGHHVRCFYPLD